LEIRPDLSTGPKNRVQLEFNLSRSRAGSEGVILFGPGPVTQADLLSEGLRLSAPNGAAFPPPTPVGSGTAGLEQLVFHGHFDDDAAASCVPDRVQRCQNTFVVSDYSGYIR